MWEQQFPVFSQDFRCIAPNLAGFGDSARLRAPDTIEGHARQVLHTLDQLGVERFPSSRALDGRHGGAADGCDRAERIERLVLYGTGPVGLLPDRFESIETSRQRLASDGLAATARRIAATWFMKGAEADGYATCVREGSKATMQAALASLSAWETWNGTSALSRFTMPTLVVWGDGDRSYGWSQPEALWRGISGCRLAVVARLRPQRSHGKAAHLQRDSSRLSGRDLATAWQFGVGSRWKSA